MTDSSEESSEHIDHLHQEEGADCGHTNVFYRIQIQSTIDRGQQIDTEIQETTGITSKDTTALGVAGELGVSGPVPKAVVKGEGKKKWATEVTGSESDVDRRSAFVSESLSFEYEIVDPNEIDLTDPNVISGCRTTSDDGDRCPNHIQRVRREYINEISDDFIDVGRDMNDLADRTGLSELETPKSPENSTIGGYIDKVRDGLDTAMSRARSGVSTTVDRATQRFEQDETMLHVSPSDDASVTFSEGNNEVAVRLANRETETPGTTVHVAANDEMVNTSYDEDRTVTVGIADEADATIAVSPGADENEPPTVGGDDIQFSFDDGDIRVFPHDDDGIPMATDENGIIQMTVGDGHTTSEPSNEKTAEQDTTPETAKDIDPTTSRTRDPDRDEPSKSVDSAASANGAATNDAEPSNESNTKWIGSDPPENLPSWIETDSQRTNDEEGINPNAAIDPDRENTDDDTPGSIG